MKKKAARAEREPSLVDFEEGWKDAFFLDFKIKSPFILTITTKSYIAVSGIILLIWY